MENRPTPVKQTIYSSILIALTLLNALMFYLFGMKMAFNFVVYIIYFIISTAAVYYLIFAIKKRKGFWWSFLLINIYLTIHPLLLCLLIGFLREGYYGKIFY